MYKLFVIWLATVVAMLGFLILGNTLLEKSVDVTPVPWAAQTAMASADGTYAVTNQISSPPSAQAKQAQPDSDSPAHNTSGASGKEEKAPRPDSSSAADKTLGSPSTEEQGSQTDSYREASKRPGSGDFDDVMSQRVARAYQKDALRAETPSPLPSGRYVALTFDDGPSQYTPKILEILKKYQVRATFFVLGSKAAAQPDLIRQILEQGHVIGNHSWNHPDLTKMSHQQLLQEIHATNQLLENLTGQRPRLFRPPYGKTNPAVRSAVANMGMEFVLWNVDPADWDLKKATPVHARVQAGLLENSLVLLHDGGGPRQRTVESLPILIERLLQQGYRFVTVPEYLSLPSNML